MSAIRRPIYTPPSKIEYGLYTEGQEYMDAETFEEYIGVYHKYPNGAIYSGGGYTTRSRQLTDFSPQLNRSEALGEDGREITELTSENNSDYFKLTGKRFNNYQKPSFYYPQPDQNDYDTGIIKRYFVQRINDKTDIIEINRTSWSTINDRNIRGIDDGLYRKLRLDWTIAGPYESVKKSNARILQGAEVKMPGITAYLSDLDEFYKGPITGPEVIILDSDENIRDIVPGAPRDVPPALLPDDSIYFIGETTGTTDTFNVSGFSIGQSFTVPQAGQLIHVRAQMSRRARDDSGDSRFRIRQGAGFAGNTIFDEIVTLPDPNQEWVYTVPGVVDLDASIYTMEWTPILPVTQIRGTLTSTSAYEGGTWYTRTGPGGIGPVPTKDLGFTLTIQT